MSAIGAGCVSDGRLVVSLGTSGTLFGYQRRAGVRSHGPGRAARFAATTGLPPLLCTMNCTRVAEEAREAFGAGMSHDELAALACDVAGGIRRRSSCRTWSAFGRRTWPGATQRVDRHSTEISRVAGRDVPRRRRGRRTLSAAGAMGDGCASSVCPRRRNSPSGGGRFEVRSFGDKSSPSGFDARVKRPTEPESAALGAAASKRPPHLEGASVRARARAHPPPYAEDEETPNEDA